MCARNWRPYVDAPSLFFGWQTQAQALYAEGIEMALEQLQGSADAAMSSRGARREGLTVLRGIAEELGLDGGEKSSRRFAGAFGAKQVQRGDGRTGTSSARKSKGGKGGQKGKKARGNKNMPRGGTPQRDSPTAGLLELRRAPGCSAVLVGRNNLQNDHITFSVARAHELWFHARGVAGAHVLLRLEPGQDPADEDVMFAADVAAYFSKDRQVRAADS